jgi:hypothetical protein
MSRHPNLPLLSSITPPGCAFAQVTSPPLMWAGLFGPATPVFAHRDTGEPITTCLLPQLRAFVLEAPGKMGRKDVAHDTGTEPCLGPVEC